MQIYKFNENSVRSISSLCVMITRKIEQMQYILLEIFQLFLRINISCWWNEKGNLMGQPCFYMKKYYVSIKSLAYTFQNDALEFLNSLKKSLLKIYMQFSFLHAFTIFSPLDYFPVPCIYTNTIIHNWENRHRYFQTVCINVPFFFCKFMKIGFKYFYFIRFFKNQTLTE